MAVAAVAVVDTAQVPVLVEPQPRQIIATTTCCFRRVSSKSINDIPCDEPEPAANSSSIGLEANENSPFLKGSYLVRTMLI